MIEAVKKQAEIAGIVDGLSIEDYHRHHAISNSGLQHFMRSPAHYIAYRNQPPEPTAAKELGSAVHFGVLEPALFFQRYVKLPANPNIKTKTGELAKSPWATAEGKALILELSEGGKKTVLPAEEFETIQRIIDEAYSHPTVSKLLKKGKTEQSIFWTDPDTGLACRARPDYLRDDGVFIDLKTTRDASYRAFQRSAVDYGYHRQAAFCTDGTRQATGMAEVGWVNIAIECEAPFAIACYSLDDGFIGFGRNQYRGALTRLKTCIDTDEWPGYPPGIQAMEAPGYLK